MEVHLPLLWGLELAGLQQSGARGPSEVLQDGVDPPEWNMLDEERGRNSHYFCHTKSAQKSSGYKAMIAVIRLRLV